MSKERLSATVDEDVAEMASRDSVNTSGLINQLLKQHFSGGADESEILEYRIQQVESEVAELEGRLERKREELDELEGRLDSLESGQQTVIETAAEKIAWDELNEDNKKVQYWADQAGLSVAEFLNEVSEQYSSR